jgi:ADP-dependent NAD(P)H-hydrate dehydratase / NAD(P)H-hydrate epimerase
LRADRTVTFAAWKPGLLLADGAELAGEVEMVDIGLDVSVARSHRVTEVDVARWLPRPARDTHKWRAAAWVVAGSPGMAGAARLAAASALRSGAGYVRLSVPGAALGDGLPLEAVRHELPRNGWAAQVAAQLGRFHALAIGPGLGAGEDTADEVRRLVASSPLVPVVVDGDGLRALGAVAAAVVDGRGAPAAPVVLTPHDGEFASLDGTVPDPDRFGAVRRLAATTGAIVLLKGPTTLVAEPDGRVLACTAGDARLATAGSGDVLTGLIVGLLASGLGAARAAATAAVVHGRAGDLAWPRGLVAGDLLHLLPAAFDHLAGG